MTLPNNVLEPHQLHLLNRKKSSKLVLILMPGSITSDELAPAS